jgi:mannose-6-phosphate isomerase-like protein (cupin superfamily)
MPKTNPQEAKFPRWSEISKYGINTLNVGDTVKLHFHDAHEYWVIVEGRGIATSEGLEYELGPGDMLQTKAGDEHSLVVTERMVAVYLYGVMPPDGRFGYLYKGIDPTFEEWQKSHKETPAAPDVDRVEKAP